MAAGSILIGGMWVPLRDDRAGAVITTAGQFRDVDMKAVAAVPAKTAEEVAPRVAKPARRGTESAKKMEKTAPAATVPHREELIDDGPQEKEKGKATVPYCRNDKETPAAPPSGLEQEAIKYVEELRAAVEAMRKEEEENEFIDACAGGCRTVDPREAAVAGGITVGAANMWALLRDDDPGHGAGTVTKQAKRGKRTTKKSKKQAAAVDSKQTVIIDDGVVQIGSGPEQEQEQIGSGPEQEQEQIGAGAVARGGNLCRAGAVAGRICRAAIAGVFFAVWCQFEPITRLTHELITTMH